MDPFLARTMVESLSKGINPLTGQVLPKHDSCSSETIQDALLEVLVHCSIESTEQYLLRLKEEKRKQRNQTKQRYPQAGKPWTKSEESQLISFYKAGNSIYQIAHMLHRSPGAISERIKKFQNSPIYRSKK